MSPRARLVTAALALGATALTGCSAPDPALRSDPAGGSSSGAGPEVALPADPLMPLVPAPSEVPTGMVPLLAGTGTRDAAAVAGYSADSGAAATALTAHRFSRAYVAQYADPNGAQVLSVVVAQFADEAGATADLEDDLAGSSGEPLDLPVIGEASQARRQPLPGAGEGQLVTLRFRSGRTTWLLAYGNTPTADPAVAVGLARQLVDRAEAAS